jgi:hypothetical protein
MKALKSSLSAFLTAASNLFYGTISNWKKDKNKYR